MEDSKQEDQVSPPQVPPSRQITIYSNHKINKRRKSQGTKIKLTQIHEKSPEPDSKTDLVLYDNKSGDSRSYKRKRTVESDFYDNSESKSSAMERAEEFRANLDVAHPSFAKALVRSNVTVGFWMHLPMRFCKLHLPKNDTTIFLENENGEEYITNYIAERTALSGGWKAFIGAHKLVEGDILIFHLVKPLRFKVYIVRGNGSAKDKADDEFGNPSLDGPRNQIDSDQDEKDVENHKKTELLELFPTGHLQDDNQEKSLMVVATNQVHASNHTSNYNQDVGSEPLEVIKASGSTVDFEGIQGIDNFSILVNGTAVDTELSDHHRTKYYELCCSQNVFLHDNLLKSINYKLAAEIISGTVTISENIRTSKLTSSHADYAVWDKTLKGFELLGMNVGFLRSRLNRLMKLALESEEAVESECREIRLEQTRMNEEIKSLESKLLKLKERREKLGDEIEALKANAEKHELMFQEVVNAPW